MKKIGLVITRMLLGGANKIVSCILRNGSGEYNFTLFTGPEDINKREIEELKNICKIKIISSLTRKISPADDIRAYFQLKKEFVSGKFDIIHTHTSKAGFLGRIAAFHAKIPKVIHTTHGTIYKSGSRIPGVPDAGLGKWFLMQAEIYAGRKTDFFTVLSKDERDICIKLKLSTEENTVVIPNGIDVRFFDISHEEKRKIRSLMGFDKNELVLVNTSRLSSEKGHDVLINAFQNVYGKNKLAKLIIVGDGPEAGNLKAQAGELFKKGVIIFTGSTDDVRKYLAVSDIFILSSYYEGFGLSVLEAMAAGLPVIASAVGGIPEIIRDGTDGIIVPPNKPSILSEKILFLSDMAEKRQLLGENGKIRASEYSLDKMLKRFFELYDK